jgi:hypothetical protein
VGCRSDPLAVNMIASLSNQLLGLLIVTTYGAVGLLTIWVTYGRGHWFSRATVLLAMFAALFVMRAFDLAFVFAVQYLVVATPLAWRPKWGWDGKARSRATSYEPLDNGEPSDVLPASRAVSSTRARKWPVFTLLDMLLGVVVVAAVCTGVPRVPRYVVDSWAQLAVLGLSLGVVSLTAAWATWSDRRWSIRVLSLVFVIVLAASALTFDRSYLEMIVPHASLVNTWTSLLTGSTLLIVAFLNLVLLLYRRKGSRASILTGAALCVLGMFIFGPPLLVGGCLMYSAPMPTQIRAPRPNGYEDLVRASAGLDWLRLMPPGTSNDSSFPPRRILQRYQGNLSAARTALDHRSRVTLDFANLHTRNDSIESLQLLATMFLFEASLAHTEGRIDDVLESHLDAIRYGRAIMPGGVLDDVQLGAKIQYLHGMRPLARMRHRLDIEQCRWLIERLLPLETSPETLDAIIDRDDAWLDRVSTWQGRVARLFGEWSGEEALRRDLIASTIRRNTARLRLLICELAITIYQAEHGSAPASLAELTPEYLPAIPLDAFIDQPLVYRRMPTGYLLYSVGTDRIDDGGRPAMRLLESGDMLLDPVMSGDPAVTRFER